MSCVAMFYRLEKKIMWFSPMQKKKYKQKRTVKSRCKRQVVVYNPDPKSKSQPRPVSYALRNGFFLRLSTFSCTRLTRIVCDSPSIEPFFCVGHVFCRQDVADPSS